MGRERVWQGEYVLFYTACLLIIVLTFVGCALAPPAPITPPTPPTPHTPPPTTDLRSQAAEHLKKGEELVLSGKFGEALKEDEEALKLFPDGSPGDGALFHMGLIWAHPKNPGRDYKRALSCFKKVVETFPQAKIREEVNIWIFVISELLRKDTEIKILRASSKRNEATIETLQGELDRLKEEDATLKEQLEGLKEIDIGIQRKKMERLPKK